MGAAARGIPDRAGPRGPSELAQGAGRERPLEIPGGRAAGEGTRGARSFRAAFSTTCPNRGISSDAPRASRTARTRYGAPRTGGGSTSNGSGEKPPVAPMVVSLVSSSIDLLRPLRRERASMDIDDKKDVHEESHARRHKLVRDEPREGARIGRRSSRSTSTPIGNSLRRSPITTRCASPPGSARGAGQPPRRVRADAALPGGVGVEGPGHRRAAA